jgi:glycosyltransferase involved in cell wall biosynthesis
VDYSEAWHQERCTQIYSGLSQDEYDFCDESERGDYYLWVAGLGWGLYAKGLNIFLELATRNHDKQFLAYGTGNPALEEELIRINRNVHNFEYRGMLHRGVEHRNAFKRARAFIMPTQTPEPFARTNLEALSKGTPVIGSMKGSLPELIINDVAGYVTDDINVMNEKLDCTFDNRKVYEYSKYFHVDNEIKELTELSKSILGGYQS